MILKPLGIEIDMELPANYSFRRIEASDFDRGVLKVLEQLTTVGQVSRSGFEQFVDYTNCLSDQRYTLVIVNDKDQIAAIGTVFIEHKLYVFLVLRTYYRLFV
jgi:glucosamine-phosphate N-acetyltransferase